MLFLCTASTQVREATLRHKLGLMIICRLVDIVSFSERAKHVADQLS